MTTSLGSTGRELALQTLTPEPRMRSLTLVTLYVCSLSIFFAAYGLAIG